jgi:hypothetical protein
VDGDEMNYWFLPISIVTWAIYITLVTPLWILGVPLVAFAAWRRAYVSKRSAKWPEYNPLVQWKWKWMYLYGNDEDGVDGCRGYTLDATGYWMYLQQRWIAATEGWRLWRRVFMWSAIRNPMGNLRFVRWLSFIIDPLKVRGMFRAYSWGTVNYARQGVYSGLRIVTDTGKELRVGWAISSLDAKGVDDYRAKGCGFKLLVRK